MSLYVLTFSSAYEDINLTGIYIKNLCHESYNNQEWLWPVSWYAKSAQYLLRHSVLGMVKHRVNSYSIRIYHIVKYIKITSQENFSLAFLWTLYFYTIVTTSFVSMVHHKSWLYEVIVKWCHYFGRSMLIVCANYIDQLKTSRRIHLLLAHGQKYNLYFNYTYCIKD